MEKFIMFREIVLFTILFTFVSFCDDAMTGIQFTRVTSISSFVSVTFSTNGNIPIFIVSPVTNTIVQPYYKKGLVASIKLTVNGWTGDGDRTAMSTSMLSGSTYWEANYFTGKYIDSVTVNAAGYVSIDWAGSYTKDDFTYVVKMLPMIYIGTSPKSGTQVDGVTWDEFGLLFLDANKISIAKATGDNSDTDNRNFLILIFYNGN